MIFVPTWSNWFTYCQWRLGMRDLSNSLCVLSVAWWCGGGRWSSVVVGCWSSRELTGRCWLTKWTDVKPQREHDTSRRQHRVKGRLCSMQQANQWPGELVYHWPGEHINPWPSEHVYHWPGEQNNQWPGELVNHWPGDHHRPDEPDWLMSWIQYSSPAIDSAVSLWRQNTNTTVSSAKEWIVTQCSSAVFYLSYLCCNGGVFCHCWF